MRRILIWIAILAVIGLLASASIGKAFGDAIVFVVVVVVGGFLFRLFKGG